MQVNRVHRKLCVCTRKGETVEEKANTSEIYALNHQSRITKMSFLIERVR